VTELGETIANDQAIDLDAWVDARTFLLGCPDRLVAIAHKRLAGTILDNADKLYLGKWRKREQKQLPN
jgi:sigma54-dependent transcription regulator